MRKDIKKKENTFNLIIIVIFISSSTSIFQLFFFKSFKDSRNIFNSEEKVTKIEQFFGNEKSNNDYNKSMQYVIVQIYKKNASFAVGGFTEDESKKYIQNNKDFYEKNNFSKKKFLDYLGVISKKTNVNIDTKDYVEYTKKNIEKDLLDSVLDMFLKKDAPKVKNIVNGNNFKVIKGIKIVPDISKYNQKKDFTEKEIKDFIVEEIRKKNFHYIQQETRSGYIIKIKLLGVSQNIIRAIEYFLKHKEFNKEKLEKFLIKFSEDSNNFTNSLYEDYNLSLKNSSNIEITKEKKTLLNSYVSIEIIENQQKNPDTELLFKKDLGKGFVLIGDEYARVSVSEVIKSKNKPITDEFKKNFIIPSMKAIYKYDLILKIIHDLIIKHNCKETNLLKESFKGEEIEIKISDDNQDDYLKLCYSKPGDAILLYDTQNRPFIFLVTSVSLDQNFKIDTNKVEVSLEEKEINFFKNEIFLIIFQVAYNKLKTTIAA
jgi:hypothetical protein